MNVHSTDLTVWVFPRELVDLIIDIVVDSCRTDNWAERAWLVQLAQVSRFASQTARAFNRNLRSKEPCFGATHVKAISFYGQRRAADIRPKWLTIVHAITELCPRALVQIPLAALPGIQRVFPPLESSTPNCRPDITRSMSVRCGDVNSTTYREIDRVLQSSLSHLHMTFGAAPVSPAFYCANILSIPSPPGVTPESCPLTHVVVDLRIDTTALAVGGHLARQLLNIPGQAPNIGRPLQRLVFRVMESDPDLPHFTQILRDLQDERVALHVLQTSVYGLPQGRLVEIAQHGVFLHSVGLENLWTSGEQVWHPQ